MHYEARLQQIVSDIAAYSDRLRYVVKPQEVADVASRRARWREERLAQEKAQSAMQLENVTRWLQAAKLDQEDELDDIFDRAQEGTCDWIHENPKLKSWLLPGHEHNVLWLKGKPGSGWWCSNTSEPT